MTLYSMVLDCQITQQGQFFLIGLSCSLPFVFYCFLFCFFLSIGWYCGPGLIGPKGYKSLSPSFALPTFFNNNDNYNRIIKLCGGHICNRGCQMSIHTPIRTSAGLKQVFKNQLFHCSTLLGTGKSAHEWIKVASFF